MSRSVRHPLNVSIVVVVCGSAPDPTPWQVVPKEDAAHAPDKGTYMGLTTAHFINAYSSAKHTRNVLASLLYVRTSLFLYYFNHTHVYMILSVGTNSIDAHWYVNQR